MTFLCPVVQFLSVSCQGICTVHGVSGANVAQNGFFLVHLPYSVTPVVFSTVLAVSAPRFLRPLSHSAVKTMPHSPSVTWLMRNYLSLQQVMVRDSVIFRTFPEICWRELFEKTEPKIKIYNTNPWRTQILHQVFCLLSKPFLPFCFAHQIKSFRDNYRRWNLAVLQPLADTLCVPLHCTGMKHHSICH